MISGSANSPISTGMKLRPPIRFQLSKMNRLVPYTMSRPMVANSSPSAADTMPLTRFLPETPAMMVSENTMSVKNSGGPNLSANPANSPASRISDRFETKSAKQEAYRAMSRAFRASPLRVSG